MASRWSAESRSISRRIGVHDVLAGQLRQSGGRRISRPSALAPPPLRTHSPLRAGRAHRRRIVSEAFRGRVRQATGLNGKATSQVADRRASPGQAGVGFAAAHVANAYVRMPETMSAASDRETTDAREPRPSRVHPRRRLRLRPQIRGRKPWVAAEHAQLLVVGGGRAGLTAAIAAARAACRSCSWTRTPSRPSAMGDEIPLHFGQGMSGRGPQRQRHDRSLRRLRSPDRGRVRSRGRRPAADGLLGPLRQGPGAAGCPTARRPVRPRRAWLMPPTTHRRGGPPRHGARLPGLGETRRHGRDRRGPALARYGALAPRTLVVLGIDRRALCHAGFRAADAGIDVAAIVEQAAAPAGPADLVDALRSRRTEILPGACRPAGGRRRSVEAVLVAAVDAAGGSVGPGAAHRLRHRRTRGIGATPVIELLDAPAAARLPRRTGRLCSPRRRRPGTSLACRHRRSATAPASGRPRPPTPRSPKTRPAAPSPRSSPPAPPPTLRRRPQPGRARPMTSRPIGSTGCGPASSRPGRSRMSANARRSPPAKSSRSARRATWTGPRTPQRRRSGGAAGRGPAHPDQVKRLTRAGMGPCQGRRCREQVAALLALGGARAALATCRSPPTAPRSAPFRSPLAGRLPEPAPEQAEPLGHVVRHARPVRAVLGGSPALHGAAGPGQAPWPASEGRDRASHSAGRVGRHRRRRRHRPERRPGGWPGRAWTSWCIDKGMVGLGGVGPQRRRLLAPLLSPFSPRSSACGP